MGSLASLFPMLAALPIVEQISLPSLDAVVGNLMKWMNSWIGNLGWTVVLFTVLLKLITFPLDFFSRRSMKIYSLKMEKMKPQLDKLDKQYANNKQLMQQKKMALQKKMGASAFASCLPSLVTMVLFFYVFSAFNSYLGFNTIETYNTLVQTYQEQLEDFGVDMNKDADGKITYDTAAAEAVVADPAKKAVIDEALIQAYEGMNRSFLWIRNIARADVPWTHPIDSNANGYLSDVRNKTGINIDDAQYKLVMDPIIKHYQYDKNGETKTMVNGYLILPILAVGISILSQIVTQKSQKGANEMNGNQGKTMMKVMMFIFPVMFLMFSLTSSTAFTVYMTVNSIITVLTTLLINLIVEKTVKLKEIKQTKGGVGYRR